jgi:ribonuclease P protein component
MLPRKNRIKKKKEFQDVFKKGKTISGSFFILKIKKNNFNFPRFAFVVPKKIEKKAVNRNKTKRILRESVNPILPFIKSSFDFIFITRKKNKQGFQETRKELQKVLKKYIKND